MSAVYWVDQRVVWKDIVKAVTMVVLWDTWLVVA